MIIVNTRIEVQPKNKRELDQTLDGITAAMREEKGYVAHHVGHNIHNDNIIYMCEMWNSQENLDNHWRSDWFSALLGTAHLLVSEPELQIHAVAYTAGMEAVNAARGKSSR